MNLNGVCGMILYRDNWGFNYINQSKFRTGKCIFCVLHPIHDYAVGCRDN